MNYCISLAVCISWKPICERFLKWCAPSRWSSQYRLGHLCSILFLADLGRNDHWGDELLFITVHRQSGFVSVYLHHMNHLHLYHLGYRNHLFDQKFLVMVDLEAMLSIHIHKELDCCLF